jgi:hypothetical protein
MRKVEKPIVTEEREHPKRRPFSIPFAMFLSNLLSSKDEQGQKMFRGSNVGYENPIFIPKHSKFKGYMRENRHCTFNKNK